MINISKCCVSVGFWVLFTLSIIISNKTFAQSWKTLSNQGHSTAQLEAKTGITLNDEEMSGGLAEVAEACEQERLPGPVIEEGLGPMNIVVIANDLVVPAGKDFTLQTVKFSALHDIGVPIERLNVYFYEDTGNGPGAEIGSFTNLEVISENLGQEYGYDRSLVSVEMPDLIELQGAPIEISYWVGVEVYYEGEANFMEVSGMLTTPNELYFLDPNLGWTPTSHPGVFGVPAEGIISFYGDCNDMESCEGQPSAGYIAGPAEVAVCGGDEFVLAAQEYSLAMGMKYKWQRRGEGETEWSDIPSSDSPVLIRNSGVFEETEFRFYIECEESGLSDVSEPVRVMIRCYCEPESGCSMAYSMVKVTMQGETKGLENTSNCSLDGYGDFTGITPPDMLPGAVYPVYVKTNHPANYDAYIRIWIDFNQDGNFDGGELVAYSITGDLTPDGDKVFQVTIPENTSPGTYRMRIRMVFNQGNNFDACTTYQSGETEDYNIEVTAPSESCTDIPEAGIVMDDISICPGMTFDLISQGASQASDGLERIWQQSYDGQDDWSDVIGAYSERFTVYGGVDLPTYYRYKLTCASSEEVVYSDVVQVELKEAVECYCRPYSRCELNQWIARFVLKGETKSINNTTSCSDFGYSDYTYMTRPDVYAGESYSVSIGSDYKYPYLQEVKAWIDFNLDGSFSEDELIFSTEGGGLMAGGTTHFNFVLPVDLEPGFYRLRARLIYSTGFGMNFDECTVVNHGEAEDYMIQVKKLDDCDGQPEAGIVIEDFSVCPDNPYTIKVKDASIPAIDMTSNWQSSENGVDGWEEMPGATSREYLVRDTPDTPMYYRYVVTCESTESSDTSDVLKVDFKPEYMCPCVPVGDCTADGIYIEKVYIQGESITIDNETECSDVGYGGFGDYTALVAADLIPGKEYDLTISYSYHSPSVLDMRGWIDFNKNGVFDNDEEVLNTNMRGLKAGEKTTFKIVIPEGVEADSYRLRLKIAYNVDFEIDPCEFQGYGEIEDYMIEVLESPTSVLVKELDNLQYYPNPVSDVLMLKSAYEIRQVEIYDMLGQKVKDEQFGSRDVQVLTGDLNGGSYLVKITTDEGHATIQIVKD